jgi:hypothetical protein
MTLIEKCKKLIEANKLGKLGNNITPEDTNPGFSDTQKEERLAYYTLTMALNYQRDTYKLWEAAKKTYDDPETRVVFDVRTVSTLPLETLREYLGKYRLALQPNKHTHSWKSISTIVAKEWGTLSEMMMYVDYDFLKLKELVQVTYKKDFPYLSGPKIFNYWSSILGAYGHIELKNKEYIEMAVDTHILKCSVVLNVISPAEALTLGRLEIAHKWREALAGSGIAPTEMHFVLWFWSRNGFLINVT